MMKREPMLGKEVESLGISRCECLKRAQKTVDLTAGHGCNCCPCPPAAPSGEPGLCLLL